VCSVTTQPPREEGVTRLEITLERRPEPAEEVLEREIGGQKFKLGRSLGQEAQNQIVEVIARHMDAFAWSKVRLVRHLTMDPKVRPVRQRRRKFNDDRWQVIREETYQGDTIPRVASERSVGREGLREVEDVCGLYGS